MRNVAIVTLLALTTLAACAKKTETVVIAEPVSTEPVYTGKYK